MLLQSRLRLAPRKVETHLNGGPIHWCFFPMDIFTADQSFIEDSHRLNLLNLFVGSCAI